MSVNPGLFIQRQTPSWWSGRSRLSLIDPLLTVANDRYLEVSTSHRGQLHAD